VIDYLDGDRSRRFFFARRRVLMRADERDAMKQKSAPTIAERIGQATCAFHERQTGRVLKSVNVVISADTIVVTLMGALSQAEQLLAQSPERAATVQEFHHHLFQSASETIRTEIERVANVDVKEASVQVLATGNMVQVFLLAQVLTTESWSGPCTAAARQ
jgi:uncharacterized protein YbcI